VAKTTRISLKNVLLSTDFSTASDAALPYAVEVAKQFEAKLYVVHVVFPELYEALPEEAGQSAMVQAKQHAERRMQQLLSSSPFAGVPHEGIVRAGEIWDELAGIIQERHIDLVATGTHGRRGAKKMLLGSIAEEIFRLSPIPVLTVGPAVSVSFSHELRSILHPTDFSAHSWQAAEYALSLAKEFQSCLTWLHVVQQPGPDPLNRTRLRNFFGERLRELVPAEASNWCQPEYRVEFGDPVENIVRIAGQSKADLIVMGVWGADALARATTHAGNVAYRVVAESTAPVLTFRGASSERPDLNVYES